MISALPRILALLLFTVELSARSPEGTYDWSDSQQLDQGIRYAHAELVLPDAHGLECPHYDGFSPEKPRHLRLHVMRIDMGRSSLRLVATGRAAGWGKPMPDHEGEKLEQFTVRTKRETTAEFVTRLRASSTDVLVALNAQPWEPFKSGVDHPYADRLGLTVSEGTLVSPPSGRPSLVVYKDGRLEMTETNSESDISRIELAVSGFSFCLIDGKLAAPDTTLHPRTGYGLCPEKRFLYLLVIDGRQAASQGATVHDVGKWLRHYGAHEGINMDGGGSTTMARWNADRDRVEVLNNPSGGEERRVGSNLAIYRARR
jgi:hypothetical protein